MTILPDEIGSQHGCEDSVDRAIPRGVTPAAG
jgi:hypothetical protein